jgi:hypothetical protein
MQGGQANGQSGRYFAISPSIGFHEVRQAWEFRFIYFVGSLLIACLTELSALIWLKISKYKI